MNITYKLNNNVVYSCKYHVVWCPKYRRKVLINGVDVRLKELLTEYAANLSVDILEMEIMPDHVHMLLEVDPQFGIHKAVKSFKGYTSRILRQEFPYLKTKMPTRLYGVGNGTRTRGCQLGKLMPYHLAMPACAG